VPLAEREHPTAAVTNSVSKLSIVGHHRPLRCAGSARKNTEDEVVGTRGAGVPDGDASKMFDLRRTVRRGAVEHHGDLETLAADRLQNQMTHVGATPLGWWQTVKEIISVNQQWHQR
jgi:hypothetical protein